MLAKFPAWMPGSLLALGVAVFLPTHAFAADPANADWPAYLGDKARTLFSPLRQIDRNNVGQLEVAWTYETGDKGEYQANNLIVAGVLYTASPMRKVIALDAATGKELWKWDPNSERPGTGRTRQRGLVFWQNEQGGEQRLFTAAGNHLYALEAKTGQLIRGFGENGSLHLGTGLDTATPPNIGLNTPGVIYRDLLIIGGIGGPGALRAFDVHTGERRWVFHLIPRPGEEGYDTWPAEAYQTATGLMPWCGQSLDEKRGIVYISSKTAEPDFYGGARHGMNLFANSLVALDAATGRRLWHFQMVHHDLLDRDLPCAPVLLTVTHEGRKVDAVAQGSKQGLLFVFDRVTGAPLWPIEERPVPASTLRGEAAWPTQPFPVKPAPLMRQHYGEEDASDLTPAAHEATLERIKRSPNFGPFPAPSLNEMVMFPGFDGGMEWGGGAADPDGVYYVNVNEIPWIVQMVETRRADGSPLARGQKDYMLNCAPCHGLDLKGNVLGGLPPLIDVEKRKTREQIAEITKKGAGRMPAFDRISDADRAAILDYILNPPPSTGSGPAATGARPDEPGRATTGPDKSPPYAFSGFKRWLDAEGYPAIKPPWGTLNAVDLNTGELKWKVPLGEYPALKARGLPPTGTENYGGPVVTAGGLVFIGATADETIRAFDKETGAVLWQSPLPFGGNATPSTYMVNGRQYVVISAGGGKSGRPSGGSIVAFALPQ
ncbi:MAG TPA: PQQ-binding-like beta-propeller repeat protein [Chthoniobacteraceae bacterium]|jgi:quinoprotein glucose dehydrogenase|nr:PQQ-binding-like beta-propeller repeat protein [Chthoniobacteraceae bacterium]